jgi:hypothetical protein
VATFTLCTPDGETFISRHVLPLGIYQKHLDPVARRVNRDSPRHQKSARFSTSAGRPILPIEYPLRGAASTLGSDHIIMYAEYDYDIYGTFSEQVSWHTVNASVSNRITYGEVKARSDSSEGVALKGRQ